MAAAVGGGAAAARGAAVLERFSAAVPAGEQVRAVAPATVTSKDREALGSTSLLVVIASSYGRQAGDGADQLLWLGVLMSLAAVAFLIVVAVRARRQPSGKAAAAKGTTHLVVTPQRVVAARLDPFRFRRDATPAARPLEGLVGVRAAARTVELRFDDGSRAELRLGSDAPDAADRLLAEVPRHLR